jgi:hypothetical protein
MYFYTTCRAIDDLGEAKYYNEVLDNITNTLQCRKIMDVGSKWEQLNVVA